MIHNTQIPYFPRSGWAFQNTLELVNSLIQPFHGCLPQNCGPIELMCTIWKQDGWAGTKHKQGIPKKAKLLPPNLKEDKKEDAENHVDDLLF